MADASPSPGRWAFRPLPPEPRSVVELIRAGTLDAELAATLWVLIEGRVPVVVARPRAGTGKTTLLDALLVFLAPGVRAIELAGAAETFDWLPQAPELGWHAGPRTPGRTTPDDRRVAGPTRPAGRHRPARPGAVGPPALLHLGRRGPARHPGRRDRVRPGGDHPRRRPRRGLRRPAPAPGRARRRRAVASRASSSSCAASARTVAGSSRPITSARPRATCTAMSSASDPRCSPPGTRRPTRSSTSAGGSRPSWRSASGSTPGTSSRTSTGDAPTWPAWPRPGIDRRGRGPTGRRRVPRGRDRIRCGPRDELEDTDADRRRAPATIAELRASGWRSRTVKDELRANLLGAARERLAESCPGSSASTTRSSRPSRTRSSPARTSSSSASAARPRPGWPAPWSACWTSRCRSSSAASSTTTRSRRSARRPERSSSATATRPRSTGSAGTAATRRSSRRRTSRSPT